MYLRRRQKINIVIASQNRQTRKWKFNVVILGTLYTVVTVVTVVKVLTVVKLLSEKNLIRKLNLR